MDSGGQLFTYGIAEAHASVAERITCVAFTVLFLDCGLAPVPRDVHLARKQVRSSVPLIVAVAPRSLRVGSSHD